MSLTESQQTATVATVLQRERAPANVSAEWEKTTVGPPGEDAGGSDGFPISKQEEMCTLASMSSAAARLAQNNAVGTHAHTQPIFSVSEGRPHKGSDGNIMHTDDFPEEPPRHVSLKSFADLTSFVKCKERVTASKDKEEDEMCQTHGGNEIERRGFLAQG